MALGTWDHLKLEIDRADAGGFTATLDASSGEHLSFDLPSFFVSGTRGGNYLALGVTAASGATTERKLLIDDVALTIFP